MDTRSLEELTAIQTLDNMFPDRIDTVVGLGSFILNILECASDDPEYDAENIAIAILRSLAMKDMFHECA